MATPNIPSNSNVSQNLPTSLLISDEHKLLATVMRFGEDFVRLVFARFKQPPSSLRGAAMSKAPTLYEVTSFSSRQATLMWLRFHIAETFAFLGIYDTASKQQVVQTAELILDHEIFGQLNLSEFLMFLSRFKRGDYGKIYQSARPNPQEFLMCLRPFWNELAQHRIYLMKKAEEERNRKEAEEDRKLCITRDEWEIIKQITQEYDIFVEYNRGKY